MKRAAPWVLLALGLVGAWFLRAAGGTEPDPESAYRLRLAELALATGAAPASDRFLAHPEGGPVPWPVLFHGSLAAVARVAFAERGEDPLSGDAGARLERLAAGLAPWLGAGAALLAYVALRRLPGATSWTGLGAAALYAFLPQIAQAESAARVDPQACVTALCFLQLGLLPAALSGRELTDVTLAALLCGLCGGLALLADAAALLFVACAVGSLAWQGWVREGDARANARRAAILYAVTVAAVTILPPTEHGPRLAALLPALAGRSLVDTWPWAWLAWVVFPLAWLALLPRGREPERAFLLLLGAASCAAASLDARFASVFVVALVATLALAVTDLPPIGRASRRAAVQTSVAALSLEETWPCA